MTEAHTPASEPMAHNSGLKIHATAFAIVVPLLAAIDLATAEPYWIHWVFLGWGAGLAAHAWFSRSST